MKVGRKIRTKKNRFLARPLVEYLAIRRPDSIVSESSSSRRFRSMLLPICDGAGQTNSLVKVDIDSTLKNGAARQD
ncbi:MAG TPA: hypothetical protein VF920_12225 [Dongiaceae bacterium]